MKRLLLGTVVGLIAAGCAGRTAESGLDLDSESEPAMPLSDVCAASEAVRCVDAHDPGRLLAETYETTVVCWTSFACERPLAPADLAKVPLTCESMPDSAPGQYLCRWPAIDGLPSVPLPTGEDWPGCNVINLGSGWLEAVCVAHPKPGQFGAGSSCEPNRGVASDGVAWVSTNTYTCQLPAE